MKQHKDTLVKYSIEKSDEALNVAKQTLEINLITAQNRAYYAIFYIVLALAYSEEFATGKHHQLMGWFNKKYIYESKIFKPEMKDIYRNLLSNREIFDYNVTKFPEYDEVQKSIEKAEYFIETVKKFMNW